MLVGKRHKETKTTKIRRCVVRLKRMKTQPIKMTRSAVKGQGQVQGLAPLKKRQISSPIMVKPETSSFKAKERLNVRIPVMQRTTKIIQQKRIVSPVAEELPPTIAAGRSRRAVKPNPKYTSEDMVTPRNLKGKKDNETDGLQRKASGSSLEDFFNKESSDDEIVEQIDTDNDKEYTIIKEQAMDSDFGEATDSDVPPVQKRPRGRPRKILLNETVSPRKTRAGTPTILNKSAPVTKTLPTQLQQLRKTLGASTVSPLSLGRKRKMEESGGSGIAVAAKRFHLAGTGQGKSSTLPNIGVRRSSTSFVLNGSNRTTTATTEIQKREAIVEKKPGITTLKTPISMLTTRTLHKVPMAQTKTVISGGRLTLIKQPTTQTIVPSRLATAKSKIIETIKERNSSSSKSEEPTKSIPDDFETMPTFTIVNINDIINKKGDVLISKTARPSDAKSDRRGPISSQQQQQQQQQEQQQQKSKILGNKITPDRFKSSQQFRTSTPFMRKPMEKSLTSSLQKFMGRSVMKASAVSDRKPAPRILNSVVGRKTQPVKAMIANLDATSDNPSCSLSLFDDDDDDDDNEDDDDNGDDEDEEDIESKDSTFSDIEETLRTEKARRPYGTATANNKNKSNEPKTATKENSPAATNRLPQNEQAQNSKLDGRKPSPEKVVISKQGDKIIKKITCFETWYVINIPADAPEEYQRNNLNMPLIELANSAKKVSLPTDLWTAKVTLYELSSSLLTKARISLYTGDLNEHNIIEADRAKYQPSCVMFRRGVPDRVKSQLPYDRAVIFKNKTFFTNIEGKNVKLVGAPCTITDISEIETLLHIVDTLTLQSPFVEPAATVL